MFKSFFTGNVLVEQFGTGTFISETMKSEDYRACRQGIRTIENVLTSCDYHLVILDEINVAIDFKMISEDEVLNLIKEKPKNLELVLTGRDASNRIIALADYYTEICEHKHPYQRNILARKGVEY